MEIDWLRQLFMNQMPGSQAWNLGVRLGLIDPTAGVSMQGHGRPAFDPALFNRAPSTFGPPSRSSTQLYERDPATYSPPRPLGAPGRMAPQSKPGYDFSGRWSLKGLPIYNPLPQSFARPMTAPYRGTRKV